MHIHAYTQWTQIHRPTNKYYELPKSENILKNEMMGVTEKIHVKKIKEK
jgi:hypothetical protein